LIQAGTTIYRADALLPWRLFAQQWPRPTLEWCDWLLDPGSLTERLQMASQGTFKVQVLEEGWCYHKSGNRDPFTTVVARQMMWSRSVLLLGQGEPWVAAHSLIPVSSLRGSLRQLVKLRDRPLGGFLFKHPSLLRCEPQIVNIGDHWGRRSLFQLEGRPLLVAEFFLPALMNRLQQSGI
jgi:chorismate lyase